MLCVTLLNRQQKCLALCVMVATIHSATVILLYFIYYKSILFIIFVLYFMILIHFSIQAFNKVTLM